MDGMGGYKSYYDLNKLMGGYKSNIVLKWLREHGCPWDLMTVVCEYAVAGGHLEALTRA